MFLEFQNQFTESFILRNKVYRNSEALTLDYSKVYSRLGSFPGPSPLIRTLFQLITILGFKYDPNTLVS